MADNGSSPAGLFGLYLVAALDIYSFISSSPQTVELNASTRANTLMKYVNMGSIGGIGVGVIGILLAPSGKKMWPAIGAGTGVVFAHLLYMHAKQAGLKNPGKPTEQPLSVDLTTIRPVYRGQAQLVSAPPNYATIDETQEHARGLQ